MKKYASLLNLLETEKSYVETYNSMQDRLSTLESRISFEQKNSGPESEYVKRLEEEYEFVKSDIKGISRCIESAKKDILDYFSFVYNSCKNTTSEV